MIDMKHGLVVRMERGRGAAGEIPQEKIARKWTEEERNRGKRGREALYEEEERCGRTGQGEPAPLIGT